MNLKKRFIIIPILIISIIALVIVIKGYMSNEKSIDLHDKKINDIKLNSKLDNKKYSIREDIIVEGYKFYEDQKNGLIIKVKDKSHKVVGLNMNSNKNTKTNIGIAIGDSTSKIEEVYEGYYKKKKMKKDYNLYKIKDKQNKIHLHILTSKDKVIRIELFTK